MPAGWGRPERVRIPGVGTFPVCREAELIEKQQAAAVKADLKLYRERKRGK